MAAIGSNGRELAIALEKRYPHEDWVAELAQDAGSGAGPEGHGLMTEDDLPVTGLPGNLGKLHQG